MEMYRVRPSKIYVDVDRNGCFVWTNTNEVFHIDSSNMIDLATKIRNLVSYILIDKELGESKLIQDIEVAIEKVGYGQPLIDILDNLGIKVKSIRSGKWLLNYIDKQEIFEK